MSDRFYSIMAYLKHKMEIRMNERKVRRNSTETREIKLKNALYQEYESIKKNAELIQIVYAERQPDQTELADLQHAVDNVSLELQKLVVDSLMSLDDEYAELCDFDDVTENQLAIDSMAKLFEIASNMRHEVQVKEELLQQIKEITVPEGEELQRFVSELRARGVTYKERKILVGEAFADMAAFYGNNDNKGFELIVPKNAKLLANACRDLATKVKKEHVELRLLRQQLEKNQADTVELRQKCEDAEKTFDSSINNITAEIQKLEDEISVLKKENKVSKKQLNIIKADNRKKQILVRKFIDDFQLRFANKHNDGKIHEIKFDELEDDEEENIEEHQLEEVNIEEHQLEEVNIEEHQLEEVNIEEHQLEEVNIEEHQLEEGNIEEHQLEEVNIEEHQLEEVNIEEHQLEEGNIEEHQLEEVNIEEHQLEEVNIEEHQLEEVNIEEHQLEEGNIEEHQLEEVNIEEHQLEEVNIEEHQLEEGNIEEHQLEEVNIEEHQLEEVNIEEHQLEEVNIEEHQLEEGNIEEHQLEEVNIEEHQLEEVNIEEHQLEEVNIEEHQLEEVNIEEHQLEEVKIEEQIEEEIRSKRIKME